MLNLVCIAREVFFFCLGRVHVISTGPISTVQTEVRSSTSILFSAQLDTDRSHKTALTADEKRYLAVYIY
ncbi:unnamed protein product [Staurois parvus]|uniref:Secreted protein n=1 Tax=Staurois parvus TaxID=386267 RepID=A0ABN9ET43_9NEOB|nr:unnamed protein product [Staurois parvus]